MEITVPFLNIPDPQVYIRDSGITLEEEPKGVLILKRTKPATWSETGTKMSVFDVVKNAIDCGYVVNFTQELLNQAAGSDMTMAGGSQGEESLQVFTIANTGSRGRPHYRQRPVWW